MSDQNDGLNRAIGAVKIGFNDPEKEKLHGELNRFITWLDPLVNLDTGDAVESHFSHGAVNVLRDDCHGGKVLAEIQEAAANFAGGFYHVPRIID